LATACDGTLATTAQFTSIRVVCNNTLAIALRGSTSAGVVKVPHSTRFDAEKVKQQLGISVRAWDEHMYEMKQLSQRKVTQQEAAAYFDAVFNNTSLSIAESHLFQWYCDMEKIKGQCGTGSKALLQAQPELLQQYPQSRQGSRRFNIYSATT
jgi:phage/plasmid-like protein (TIGR03299 family)